MCTVSREEAAWSRGARERKMAHRESPYLARVSFLTDLAFAETTATFAKRPRADLDFFARRLPRTARPFFRAKAPLHSFNVA
jgi:hypothetical protein